MPLYTEILQCLGDNDKTLTLLDLANNKLGDLGVRSLAAALEKNITLESLNLYSNCIGAAGAQSLAEALEKNTTLKSLNLNCNQISDGGAQSLASALEKNTTLKSLQLSMNKISDAGVHLLTRALAKNTALISLNLNNNPIGDTAKTQIQYLLKRNQHYLPQLQASACQQLKLGRILLYKVESTNLDDNNKYLGLPLEIREKIVTHAANTMIMSSEQQRMVINYAKGEIEPVADNLLFFKVTKCDRIRKQLRQDEIEASFFAPASII